jgi:replicative DNA helicase
MDVVSLLRSEDFYHQAHQRIYEAITDLLERGEPVDLVTVTARLRDKGHLDDLGGASYVTALMNAVPTVANVEYHARIVKRHALRRHMAKSCETAVYNLLTQEPEVVLRSLQESLSARQTADGDRSGLVMAPELRAEPVTYAIHELVPMGTLTLLSGKDKRGKTLFALEMLRAVRRGEPFLGHFAVKQGSVAGFFLDDPEGLTVERLERLELRQDSRVLISTSRRAHLTDPAVFLRDAERKLREVRPVLVVLDALYLLVPASRDAANDQARMAPIMHQLNALAECTSAAVLVVTHDSKSGIDVAGSHVIRASAKAILRLLLPQGSEEDPDEGPTTPRRVLRVESKLAPAASWALDLRGVGQWKFLGTQRAAREATVQGLVRDYLVAGNAGTVEEIAQAVNRRRADVEQAIGALRQTGETVVEDLRPGGRGRPRRVCRVVLNFRPEPADGKLGTKGRAHQQVPTPMEFPSGQSPPREGQGDRNSTPDDPRRTGEAAEFDRFIGLAMKLFGGEVVYDGPPKPGPDGSPVHG